MAGVLLGLHILVSLALVIVVLLQSGKGGGLAGAFGGAGGVGAVFGGQTAADFLTKATRYLAIAFFLSSLVLAIVSRQTITGTVQEGLERRGATPATETGQPVPPEEIPEGLPGATGEMPGGDDAQTGTAGEATGVPGTAGTGGDQETAGEPETQ